MAAGDSFTVHVSGTTDSADCGTITNTASVTTQQRRLRQATTRPSSWNCPDVTVEKTPDGGSVNAGGTAQFTIEVTNLGPGVATDVTLTDNLPAGIDWDEDSASCTITGRRRQRGPQLRLRRPRRDEIVTVHVSGLTSADDCGAIPNTATVDASNEAEAQAGNNSDDGPIEVLCADIAIVKDGRTRSARSTPATTSASTSRSPTTATARPPTSTSTDELPDGFDWVLGAVTGDADCSITAPRPTARSWSATTTSSGRRQLLGPRVGHVRRRRLRHVENTSRTSRPATTVEARPARHHRVPGSRGRQGGQRPDRRR